MRKILNAIWSFIKKFGFGFGFWTWKKEVTVPGVAGAAATTDHRKIWVNAVILFVALLAGGLAIGLWVMPKTTPAATTCPTCEKAACPTCEKATCPTCEKAACPAATTCPKVGGLIVTFTGDPNGKADWACPECLKGTTLAQDGKGGFILNFPGGKTAACPSPSPLKAGETAQVICQ